VSALQFIQAQSKPDDQKEQDVSATGRPRRRAQRDARSMEEKPDDQEDEQIVEVRSKEEVPRPLMRLTLAGEEPAISASLVSTIRALYVSDIEVNTVFSVAIEIQEPLSKDVSLRMHLRYGSNAACVIYASVDTIDAIERHLPLQRSSAFKAVVHNISPLVVLHEPEGCLLRWRHTDVDAIDRHTQTCAMLTFDTVSEDTYDAITKDYNAIKSPNVTIVIPPTMYLFTLNAFVRDLIITHQPQTFVNYNDVLVFERATSFCTCRPMCMIPTDYIDFDLDRIVNSAVIVDMCAANEAADASSSSRLAEPTFTAFTDEGQAQHLTESPHGAETYITVREGNIAILIVPAALKDQVFRAVWTIYKQWILKEPMTEEVSLNGAGADSGGRLLVRVALHYAHTMLHSVCLAVCLCCTAIERTRRILRGHGSERRCIRLLRHAPLSYITDAVHSRCIRHSRHRIRGCRATEYSHTEGGLPLSDH
jgi:hypothetical protein